MPEDIVAKSPDEEEDGMTGTDIAVGAVGAELAWKFKRQSGWLLKSAWKLGSAAAKRYPYSAALLIGFEALNTEAGQAVMEEVWVSLGKGYTSMKAWVDDASIDENVAHASLDAINRAKPEPDGLVASLPPDLQAAIPQGVRDALVARHGSTSDSARKPSPATVKSVRDQELLKKVGSIFGNTSPAYLCHLHSVLSAFVAMSHDDVENAADIRKSAI
jgi:hypothetical protein